MADKLTESRKQLGQFDLGRLTAVGWLLFLGSVAGPLALCIYTLEPIQAALGLAKSRGADKLVIAGFVLLMIGTFLAGRFLLDKAGITAVRPAKPAA